MGWSHWSWFKSKEVGVRSRKNDKADAKQRCSFAKILGKIKKYGWEWNGSSEELPVHGICEGEQSGTCIIQADGRDLAMGLSQASVLGRGAEKYSPSVLNTSHAGSPASFSFLWTLIIPDTGSTALSHEVTRQQHQDTDTAEHSAHPLLGTTSSTFLKTQTVGAVFIIPIPR